jgi:hypothetical protein
VFEEGREEMRELFITLNISPAEAVLFAVYLLGLFVSSTWYLKRYEGRIKYHSREVYSEAVVFATLWPVMICVLLLWRGIDYIRERRSNNAQSL